MQRAGGGGVTPTPRLSVGSTFTVITEQDLGGVTLLKALGDQVFSRLVSSRCTGATDLSLVPPTGPEAAVEPVTSPAVTS